MGWDLISPLSEINLDYSWCIDWISFVWVHNNTKETRISVDKLALETSFQIVEYGGIVKGAYLHLFWSLLYCCEPIQKISNLYTNCNQGLSRKEEK
jgi:hypothetical protein